MKSLILVIILTIVSSCQNSERSINIDNNQFSLPDNIVIESKTFATIFKIDKSRGIDIIYCQSDSTSINSIENCIIQNSDTLKYIRKATFLFDTLGQIKNFLKYHSEGVVHYSTNDLIQDTAIASSWNTYLRKVNSIRINAKNNYVIDNNDTFKIYDHWSKQKFIFAYLNTLDKTTIDNDVSNKSIIYSYK